MLRNASSNRAILRTTSVAALLVAVGVGTFAPPQASIAAVGKPPPAGPPADPAIAFVVRGRLMVMNADGSNATVIYSGNIPFDGSWSPDASSITFTEHWDVWRIDVSVINGVPTGNNLMQLTGDQNNSTESSWSPSGEEIAYLKSSTAIEVIPAAGGAPTVLYATPGGSLGGPAWSRDGSALAFPERDVALTHSIRLLDRTSGAVVTLAETPAWANDLDWARTCDMLAFGMYVGDVMYVCTFDMASGAISVITPGSGPSWSPDDAYLVFMDPGGKLAKVELATGAVSASRQVGRWPDWRRF